MFERYERDFNHHGLYVSEKTPDEEADFRRLQQEVDGTYAALPLEGCTTGYDVLSERYRVVPPAGKVFRMTGKFAIELEGECIEDYYSPSIASFEIAEAEAKTHPLYDMLATVDDNPEKMIGFIRKKVAESPGGFHKDDSWPDWYLQEFLDEFKDYIPKYIPPRDFLGKYLSVQVQSNGRGNKWVGVAVYGQPEMLSHTGWLPIALPIAESGEDEVYFADVQTYMHWWRDIAGGKVGDMAIELCDEPEEFRQFTRTEDRSRVKWDELWTPLGFATTSHEYINFMFEGFNESAEWLESARIYEMRRHREMRDPFADDPARYFRIATLKEEDYYTRQRSLRQIVTPRSSFAYHDGIVRETVEETLSRYVGRTVTPEVYGKSLKAFDEKGRYKGDAHNLYLAED